MGNTSSQLAVPTDKVDGFGDGTNLGPATPPARVYDGHAAEMDDKVFGPRMSPLLSDDDGYGLNPTNRSNPSSKKKQKKRRKSNESAITENDKPTTDGAKKNKKKSRKKPAKQEGPPVEASSMQPEAEDPDAGEVDVLPKRKHKKKTKKNANRHLEDNEELDMLELVSSSTQVDPPPASSEPQQPTANPQSPSLGKETKIRRKKNNNLVDFGVHPQLAPGGRESPPSAQVPTVNGSLGDAPNVDDESSARASALSSQLITERRPSNQSEDGVLSASQIKTEELSNDEDEELSVQPIGLPNTDASLGNGSDDDMRGWLHKREDDVLPSGTQGAYAGMADEFLPDLLPSQVKSEHQSDTDSDSDAPLNPGSESDSPSAARAERLDMSRSRSASKASTSLGEGQRLADEAVSTLTSHPSLRRILTKSLQLGISAPTASEPSSGELDDLMSSRASTPYSGPSSTGSDRSIPPRIESLATSFPAEPSEQRGNDDAPVDNDTMDVTNGGETPKARPTRSPAQTQESATDSWQVLPSHTRKQAKSVKKRVPGFQGNDPSSDRDLQVMADWLQGNGKENQNPRPATLNGDSTPQSSLQHDTVIGNGALPDAREPVSQQKQPKGSVNRLWAGEPEQREPENAEAESGDNHEVLPADPPRSSMKRRRPKSSYLESEDATASQQIATATAVPAENDAARNDSIEPGESASQPQPKAKRKRKLQPKTSLSLSQLEGDDPGEGESRLSTFSQRSKRKDTMRGGSNEPSEVDISREPSLPPQQPRKPRRKKRTENDVSGDEMENLLAAGPSKTRKRANKLDQSDEEDVRAAKRKRLAKNSGGAASGPWTAEEYKMIEKVYADFRDANGMTEEELNAMIHERPDKANNLHQEFWNRADVAIAGRTRKQIVERVRRLYNNFTARGTWTDEQKEEVHELFEKHGNKFAHIAGLINRDQKDIRDYWRNRYLVHETQVKRRWTKEDTARLKEVVEEALGKIRIQRENSGELRTRPRAAADDEESLLDWHQISAAMNLTRSRAQCKWKWIDMREKGLVGDQSSRAPTQAASSVEGSGKRITDISDELIQAREGFDKMTDEDKRMLTEAIHACKPVDDANIPWSRLVSSQFRAKWMRPTLRLAWYRLRRSVPDYGDNTVEDNARYLLNHINNLADFPLIREGHIDDLGEEKLIHPRPGNRLWKRPSQDLRATAERQRRAARLRQNTQNAKEGVARWLRDNSIDLGDGDEDDQETEGEGDVDGNDQGVPIRIPKHLKGEAAKKALAEARARAKGQGTRKGKEPARGVRSASVAIDSDSE